MLPGLGKKADVWELEAWRRGIGMEEARHWSMEWGRSIAWRKVAALEKKSIND